MNQNKIFGRAIADAMLVPVTVNGKQEYRFRTDKSHGEEKDFYWRVARSDLAAWGIKKEDLMDIVDQIKAMGPIEALRDALGIIPGQGAKLSGLTLRSASNPKIAAHVVVNSRSSFGDPWTNFGDYGQAIELFFFYDIYHEADAAGAGEDILGDMNTLMYGGMTVPGAMNP